MSDDFFHDDEREQLVSDIKPGVRHALGRDPWWREPWKLFIAAALVLLALAFVGTQVELSTKDDQIQSERDHNAATSDDVQALQQQVRGLGGTPVAGPSGAAGASGATGSRGPGPTGAQVAAAVTAYCASHGRCTAPLTPATIRAVVAGYCASGRCRGATGRTGSSGAIGSPGPSGAAGTEPSSSDVAAAVAGYCDTHAGCTGAKGDTGAQGPPGPSGPSGPAGPACTTGFSLATVTPIVGPAYEQCQQEPTATPTGSSTP